MFIRRGIEKEELDEMTWKYVSEKRFTVIDTCKCERFRLYKINTSVKKHKRKFFFTYVLAG